MSSNNDRLQIIYIEDSLADAKLLETKLQKSASGAAVHLFICSALSDAKVQLRQGHFDLVLLDLSLPDAHGLEGVVFFREKYPNMPVVVLTGNTDTTTALEAIKIGAQDYLIKGDFQIETFLRVCKYAVERKKINTQLNTALNEVEKLNEDLNNVNAKLQHTIEALEEEKNLVIKKNRKINAFLSTIIHDLKNPVAAVNTLSELMLSEADRLTIPHIKFLNQIKHSSSSMLDNILTIIETTRVKQDGDLGPELVFENPYFTMNSAIDKYIVEAIQRNIILVIGYRKDLPKVYFDKRLLTNVISYLLENAIAHNQENSRILIHCERIADEVKVSFENRGLQMPEEDMDKVFDEDHNLAGTVEGLQESSQVESGFRLSVMKKFVEIMGGTVGIERPEGGQGTTLWFTLQAKRRKEVISD